VLMAHRPESGKLRLHVVPADGKERRVIETGFVGHHNAFETGLDVANGDRDAGECAARFVGHRSVHRSGNGLSNYRVSGECAEEYKDNELPKGHLGHVLLHELRWTR